MKTFDVTLTKSYIIRVKAKKKEMAKEVSEFYTSDIHDISEPWDRKKNNFKIENIECTFNETFNVAEVYERD